MVLVKEVSEELDTSFLYKNYRSFLHFSEFAFNNLVHSLTRYNPFFKNTKWHSHYWCLNIWKLNLLNSSMAKKYIQVWKVERENNFYFLCKFLLWNKWTKNVSTLKLSPYVKHNVYLDSDWNPIRSFVQLLVSASCSLEQFLSNLCS